MIKRDDELLPRNEQENIMRNYIKICLVVIVLVAMAWAFAWPFRVSGDCMEPAIKDGRVYFLNRALPFLRGYKINDIVLFEHERKVWISRIVALENDTIQINESNLTLNGVTRQDASIQRNWTNWKNGDYAIEKPLQVPPGHVYVLSDTLSAEHDDSRVFGPVSKKIILSIVW